MSSAEGVDIGRSYEDLNVCFTLTSIKKQIPISPWGADLALESDDEGEMRLCDIGRGCYRCRSRYLVQVCIQAVI